MSGFTYDWGRFRYFSRERASKVKRPEGTPDSRGTKAMDGMGAWGVLATALRSLRKKASLIPPLESAIDGFISILGAFEASLLWRVTPEAAKIKRNQQEWTKLAQDLGQTTDLLREHLRNSKYIKIHDRILSVAKTLDQEVRLFKQRQESRSLDRPVGADPEEDILRHYYRMVQLFQRIQIETGMSTWRITNEHLENTRLENMNPAKLGRHDSLLSVTINRHACAQGTREKTLSELNYWSDDPMGQKVMWVAGMAGTGKTTIAYTLAKVLESRGQLAASFFCTRTTPECHDANRIIPTIAYQLARQFTVFQSSLCQALDSDPDIGSREVPTQFSRLLQEPLQAVGARMPNNLVVIVDALDECDDVEVAQSILGMLFQLSVNLPLKFFITSRPELELVARDICNETASGLSNYATLQLHEIERETVRSDIEAYLRQELATLQPAPPQNEVKRLSEMSGQLFIYAVTIVEYIRPRSRKQRLGIDPHKRLKTVLKANLGAQQHLGGLNILYRTILSAVFEDMNMHLEPDELARIRLVLWIVICLREPVHLNTLSVLTGFNDNEQTSRALQPLRSVLYVSEHNNFVSTLHKSFPDYMVLSNPEYFEEHSRLLAHRCFHLMEQLKFNICGLESSFIRDRDIKDIKGRVDRAISHPLAYACRYWGDHLRTAGPSKELLTSVNELLSQKLLFWMEVLNLHQSIRIGVSALLKAQAWLSISKSSRYLIDVASHACKFVAEFSGQAASASTPHIYISALPFSPVTSWVYRLYRHRMRGLVDIHATGKRVVQQDDQMRQVLPEPHASNMGHTTSVVHPSLGSRGLFVPANPPASAPTRAPGRNYIASFSESHTRSIPGIVEYSTREARSEHFQSRHMSGGHVFSQVSTRSAPGTRIPETHDSTALSTQRIVITGLVTSAIETTRIDEEPDENDPPSLYLKVNSQPPISSGVVPTMASEPPLGQLTLYNGPHAASLDTSTTATDSSTNTPWLIRNDGWVLNRNLELLLFVPTHTTQFAGRFKRSNPHDPRRSLARISWDDIFVGSEWVKCYGTENSSNN